MTPGSGGRLVLRGVSHASRLRLVVLRRREPVSPGPVVPDAGGQDTRPGSAQETRTAKVGEESSSPPNVWTEGGVQPR